MDNLGPMPAPPRHPIGVFVCGFMGSGNGLICRMLQRQGVAQFQDHYAKHARKTIERWQMRGWDLRIRALWPVRVQEVNRESGGRKHLKCGQDYETEFADQSRRVLLVLAEQAIPVLPVSYSRIVREPEVVGQEIADWMGVPWLGWGEEIVDGDAKYRQG